MRWCTFQESQCAMDGVGGSDGRSCVVLALLPIVLTSADHFLSIKLLFTFFQKAE